MLEAGTAKTPFQELDHSLRWPVLDVPEAASTVAGVFSLSRQYDVVWRTPLCVG